MNPKIKLAVFDFDGTFTDCSFTVNDQGIRSKSYHGRDSYGLKLLSDENILIGIISADNSPIYQHLPNFNHFNKVQFIESGVQGAKLELLDQYRHSYQLEWSEVAYMGDDLSDLECLKQVGLAGCPADANPCIFGSVHFKSNHPGGKGAVREFVEYLIRSNKNTTT